VYAAEYSIRHGLDAEVIVHRGTFGRHSAS
jgi:hypothetical protein